MAPPLTRPAPPSADARPGTAAVGRADGVRGTGGEPAPGGPGRPGSVPVLVHRARLVVVCLGLVGLMLTQQPGRIVSDTKLDLVVDPWGFLARALHMWEPQSFAGLVQNQAYGYLFPMGPFFGAGLSLGLEPWVVQRLWMAALLCAAFLGFVALAERLDIGSPGVRLLGGLAYALAPRMLTGIGAVSVEVLPMAVAPWVLVPLVAGATRGSPRRAAALSGIAVLCVGGVNAVATAAVLPLAALWLLTRPAGPRRRRLLGWWVASVALATAWWAGALLLLGRYSAPFLDYIESASTTTSPTELTQTLRGTTHWVAYLTTAAGPQWPAGWALATEAVPVVGTVVVAAGGLAALALPRLPHRRWLVLGVLGGTVLVTAGHVGTVDGLFAGPLREALDGVLAPLRNVHKWDPVLRLPLVLALTHLVAVLARWATGGRAGPPWSSWVARGVGAVLVLGLLATVSPAVAQRLTPPGAAQSIPPYWQATADWLDEREPEGRALLLPSSSFAVYSWGTTLDEPMQPLAGSPWEVRNAIPFTPAGHIRMLDSVGGALVRGEGSAGLSSYLARSGISYLVVRNDLDTGAARATRPLLVHRALADSPGIERVATFGPRVPAEAVILDVTLDEGLTPQRPAVEVYAVEGAVPTAYTTPLESAVTVLGGPDGVLALEERGLLDDRAALPPGADPAAGTTTMVSDALVRRERTFGRIGDAASAGLTADDPLRRDVAARDYLIDGHGRAESVVRLDGGTVRASSSRSDADTFGAVRPEDQPYAALDGDPTTAWRPAVDLGEPKAAWWQVVSDVPVRADRLTVVLDVEPGSRPPGAVVVRTDAGERTVPLEATERPQQLPLPPGDTRTITIEAQPEGGTRPALALAEVEVPGLRIDRTVVTPVPSGPVAAYAFDTANPASSGCVVDPGGRPRCGAALVSGAEEPGGLDRRFTVVEPDAYELSVTAVPRPGAALDALIAEASELGATVTATSSAVPDPRGNVLAAVDGDPLTTWTASGRDREPALTVRFDGPRMLDRLQVRLHDGAAAARPTAVTLSTGGFYEALLPLDDDGVATFAPVVAEEVTLSFPLAEPLRSFDPYTRRREPLGVGVSELRIGGLTPPDPDTTVTVPCGEGPVLSVDGNPRQTELVTTLAGLRSLRPVQPVVCDGLARTGRLDVGQHSFTAASTPLLAVDAATLTSVRGVPGVGERSPVDLLRWDAEHRAVAVAARREPQLLVVPENVNDGWTATLDGQRLAEVTVDGWQQGYVLPAGAPEEVRLDFTPGAYYRGALIGGLVAIVVLGLLAALPARRSGPPAGARRSRGLVVAGTALAGMLLLAGPVGLGATLVLGAGAALAGRYRAAVLAGTAAAGMLTAGTLLLLAPGGATEPLRQGSAVVALAAVAGTVLPAGSWRPLPAARSGTSVRQRRSGRSTSS